MNEQQVERVAEAMFLSENPLAASGDWDSQQRAVYENLARAALGDVEPEPLGVMDILDGRWVKISILPGPTAHIEYERNDPYDYAITSGTGPTIDAAIRAAIANATKGGEA